VIQAQIFEPFFTTKPEGKGTGLGLPTVYGIVKQNNGFIHVYSEPGQGTAFSIHFPRHIGAVGVQPKKTESQKLSGDETVLVVEDEEQILRLAQLSLESQGYHVIVASDPGAALLTCEKYPGTIHLLLTDVIMPLMNGRDLKERIERIKPGIRTVFMSGYTSDVIILRGISDAGMHFIQKPFTPTKLAMKIREVLDTCRLSK
jgi:two-component system, cell cycle sensor histidine kinase and response regulator CckA